MDAVTAIGVIGVLLAVNLGLSVALRRTGLRGAQWGMHMALVWLVPVAGALVALLSLAALPKGAAAAKALTQPPEQAPAPLQLARTDGCVLDIEPLLGSSNGFVLMDWSAVHAWAAAAPDAAGQSAALNDAHRAWLMHMRDALGAHFHLLETDECYLLSSLESAVARAMTGFVRTSRERIKRVLGPVAQFPHGMKSVIVVMDDHDDYYNYVAMYYPEEGEFALSGGMFIPMGCPHFLLVRDDLHAIEPVIAHELTHSALAHWKLPLWLDEGIAVSTEHRLCGVRSVPYQPREMQDKHRSYWTGANLQAFWVGDTFRRSDDGNLLSYDLANRLVTHMGRHWEAFTAFVQQADQADAGSAAAKAHFGLDLGQAAAAVLGLDGDADWSPRLPLVQHVEPVVS
jgi:hypothetical protein